MRLLPIIILLSSCALFDGAKSIIGGAYEAGKYEGRAEVLEALKKNEESLEPFKNLTVQQLLDLSKETTVMAPTTIMIVKLLIERGNLKKELKHLNAKAGTQ